MTVSNKNTGFIDGALPRQKLYTISHYPIDKIDLNDVYRYDYYLEMKDYFLKNLNSFRTILLLINNNVRLIKSLDSNIYNTYFDFYSSIISSGYYNKYYYVDVNAQNTHIRQVVTSLDKLLYSGFGFFYHASEYIDYEFKDRDMKIAYFFLNVLTKIQQIEIEKNITLNFDIGEESFNPYMLGNDSLTAIINADFGNINNKEIRKLTKNEASQITKVLQQRMETLDFFRNKRIAAISFVNDSNNSSKWNILIDIINDMSSKERQLLSYLQNPIVKGKNKIREINSYISHLKSIERGFYILKGKKVMVLPILDCLIERMNIAPDYCVAKLENGNNFELLLAAMNYFICGKNFNYLVIMIYKLLLENEVENFSEVLTIIWKLLDRNLGDSSTQPKQYSFSDFDAIIDKCVDLIEGFYKENKDIILQLSYLDIQEDLSLLPNAKEYSLNTYLLENIDYHLEKKADLLNDENSMDKMLNFLIEGNFDDNTLQDTIYYSEFKNDTLYMENLDNEALSLPFIKSLNIIYLLNVFIDQLLKNKKIHYDLNHIKKAKRILLKIDREVTASIYKNSTIDVTEYREEKIIDITKQNTEYYVAVIESVLGNIKSLIEESVNDNIEGMMKCFFSAKAQLGKISDIYNYDLMTQVDEMLIILKNRIINEVEKSSNQYIFVENEIKNSLGEGYNILPVNAKKELITAELLFKNYGNCENENMGFDFSCISSLFYQAVESAYNILIWEKYKNELNNVVVDGVSYPKWFKDNTYKFKKNKDYNHLNGYLPKGSEDYYLYFDKNTKDSKANEYCMMGNMASLLENMYANPTGLIHFVEYLYELFNINSKEKIDLNHRKFKLLQEFKDKLSIAAPKRNLASHGNRRLMLDECKEDREITLVQTKEIRNNAIGLLNIITELFQ